MRLLGAVSALALMSILVAGLILVQPAHSQELEASFYVGLWSEHYINDDAEYNEDNEILQLTLKTEDDWFVSMATFSNSHYIDSKLIGVGREFTGEYIDGLKWGIMLAAVHGYEGKIKTNVHEGILFAPISYYKYKNFKVIIVGPAVNAGVEFRF